MTIGELITSTENKTMEEIVSNCCSAPLLDLESDLCSQCLEHCDPVNLEEEEQLTPVARERIEKILKQMNVI